MPSENPLSDPTPSLQVSSSEVSVTSSLIFLQPLQVGYSYRLGIPKHCMHIVTTTFAALDREQPDGISLCLVDLCESAGYTVDTL